ncbi:MAG TPA: YCF48-related protein [Candidatus Binatia bacterium]|nr:YCF48-related protein [Candidatus Binatia bacterium]
MPKLVIARLGAQSSNAHPDPDLLIAFAERNLSTVERNHVMSHLSRCSDCREILALSLPEAVSVPAYSSTHNTWFTWPVLRWGMVAVGLLIVSTVGILELRSPRRDEKPLVAANLPAKPQGPVASESSPATANPARETTTAASDLVVNATPPPLRPRTRSSARDAAPPAPVDAVTPRPNYGTRAGAGGGIGSGNGAGMASTTVNVEAQMAVQPENSDLQAETPVGKAKPAASPAIAFSPAPSPPMRSEPALMKAAIIPRWTISDSGSVRRSFDGGQTWQDVDLANSAPAAPTLAQKDDANMAASLEITQEAKVTKRAAAAPASSKAATVALPAVKKEQSGVTLVFRALAVASPTEIWAGGNGGYLYHTRDGGNQWERVIPADSAALTGDILSIRFSSVQNGTITTSSSEIWSTSDDGQTWRRQQ